MKLYASKFHIVNENNSVAMQLFHTWIYAFRDLIFKDNEGEQKISVGEKMIVQDEINKFDKIWTGTKGSVINSL